MIWLAALLVLNPVASEAAPLRLAAVGTGDHPIDWVIDGQHVAQTRDGEAATVEVGAGRHEVVASSSHAGEWDALVRFEPRGAGLAYVPAWTAHSDGRAHGWLGEAAAVALVLAVAAALAIPKRP